jgi:Amt family ammonium transporter
MENLPMELSISPSEIGYAVNTLYLLTCGALVMFMAAGFAMLEGGLVRAKNTAEIMTKNIVLYALASMMYMFVGYDLMYGSAPGGIIPNFGNLFQFMSEGKTAYAAVGQVTAGKANIAEGALFFFQVVFVATAMSVVSGAVAERMKLWAFIFFAIVMTAFIYPVEGYWKWGHGFLDVMGFKDFAGSGIVHLTGASAALAGVLLLGPRNGKYGREGQLNAMPGANLPLATIGAMTLWFGWFGFNGGSLLSIGSVSNANTVAAIFVNTNLAASGGLLAALVVSQMFFGKADLTLVISGILAGLVAITAEPATPTPLYALIIGAVGGVLVVFSILIFDRFKIDDPIGAISVHGTAGVWGLLAVPITNEAAKFKIQAMGILSIFLWVFIASFITWLVINLLIGLRVDEENEYRGLDISECGLEAYPEFVKK